MDTTIKQRLIDVGTELDATMARFMNNEAMYEKFLVRFTKDQNFALLSDSIAAGNNTDAEHAAHTLKGVAANLGFAPLASQLETYIAKIRAGEDCTALTALYTEIKETYDMICDILHCL